MVTPQNMKLAFIGFGELAQGLVKGLKDEGLSGIQIFDKAIADNSDSGKVMRQTAKELGIDIAASLEDLINSSDVIFSAVTPVAGLVVAKAVVQYLQADQIYADLNSCTPNLKKQSMAVIQESGASYVDVGVVGGISIQGHKIPCLLCGDKAAALEMLMSPYGMNMKVVDGPVGTAALIKMLRSVVLKGIEALMLEMFMAAEEYGLQDTMMDSIAATFNKGNFEKYSDMLMSTHGLHAGRRSDEVQMILETIKEVGVAPHVTEGICNFFVQSAKLDMPTYFEGKKPADYKQVSRAIKKLSI